MSALDLSRCVKHAPESSGGTCRDVEAATAVLRHVCWWAAQSLRRIMLSCIDSCSWRGGTSEWNADCRRLRPHGQSVALTMHDGLAWLLVQPRCDAEESPCHAGTRGVSTAAAPLSSRC